MIDKLQQALDLCNKERFDDAIPLLEQVTKEEPTNSEAWRVLAQVHWNHCNDVDKAYDELIEALRCEPKNMWALILMGNLLSKAKNDSKSAREYYNKVLEYYPDNALAINNVAATYMEVEDFENAMPLFEKSIKLDDSYTNSHYGLALCHYKLGNLQEAFDTCLEASKRFVYKPENPKIREELLKLFLTVARDLAEKTNYINVWKGIKDELEMVDGKSIVFQEDKNMYVLAKLQYGPHHHMDHHVLKYNPEKPHIDHLFIHELMHLKMDQQATKAGRGKVMIGNDATDDAFNKRYYQWLRNKHKRLTVDKINEFCQSLKNGFATQLMNSPLDLFVENIIYENYKAVRPVQLLSLFKMESDNINSVRQSSASDAIPKGIVKTSKIMNLVSSLNFKKLYGIDLIHEYKPTREELERATDLFEEFEAYLNSFKPGDEYELLEYFLQSLDKEDLIDIRDERSLKSNEEERDEAVEAFERNVEEQKENAPSEDEVYKANEDFAQKHGNDEGENFMMSMYMLGAMEYFDALDHDRVKRIALEIATKGITGIHPEKKYSIDAIPNKEFGGYEFLAYYYVSWAWEMPHMIDKLGLPFQKAYEMAQSLYNQKYKK